MGSAWVARRAASSASPTVSSSRLARTHSWSTVVEAGGCAGSRSSSLRTVVGSAASSARPSAARVSAATSPLSVSSCQRVMSGSISPTSLRENAMWKRPSWQASSPAMSPRAAYALDAARNLVRAVAGSTPLETVASSSMPVEEARTSGGRRASHPESTSTGTAGEMPPHTSTTRASTSAHASRSMSRRIA